MISTLGGGRLLLGAEASKEALQGADLKRFAIVHFAAHSILSADPERSCVVLAPARPADNGHLEPREIVKLHLVGKLVVLASCSSALGTVLPGEGVMGLTRAFFEAGAHTVVGSLWPVHDQEAAAFFERFYTHLAAGKSVAAALTDAQRDRIAAGCPAADWSGYVVLGDGDLVPGGRRGSH